MTNLSSYELYKFVCLNIKTNRQIIEKLSDEILEKCISEYNLFDNFNVEISRY